jgi:hypothetical protein
VVEKQNDPGNAAQSASASQPGAHSSTAGRVTTQAFGSPRAFPPPAPSPTQSVERTHAFVHHSPPHERPGLHVPPCVEQGSPIPSSLQTGHFARMHDSRALRSGSPFGDWVSQLLTHPAPVQLCSQLRRLSQSVFAEHASTAAQQFALAHWVHSASLVLTVHMPAAPASVPPLVPPPRMGTGQLASSTSQTPSCGGLEELGEQAGTIHAAEATANATSDGLTRLIEALGRLASTSGGRAHDTPRPKATFLGTLRPTSWRPLGNVDTTPPEERTR